MGKRQPICCIGGAIEDQIYALRHETRMRASNPARYQAQWGGVARNITANLAQLGLHCSLITALGADAAGEALAADLRANGVWLPDACILPGKETAHYVAVMQANGELLVGAAADEIFTNLDERILQHHAPLIDEAKMLVCDCNVSAGLVTALSRHCRQQKQPLAVNAVSPVKAQRLPQNLAGIDTLFCALDEAAALIGTAVAALSAEAYADRLVQRGARQVVVSLGPQGLVFADAQGRFHQAAAKTNIVDVSGAGDALMAGFLYVQFQGGDAAEACHFAQRAAAATLTSHARTIPAAAVPDLIEEYAHAE